MHKYIFSQLLQLLVLIALVSFLSYIILYLLPGSSAQLRFGLDASPTTAQKLSIGSGLQGYFAWAKAAIRGDWGTSEYSNNTVISVIAPRWIITLSIAILSLLPTIGISILWCRAVFVLSHKNSSFARIATRLFSLAEHILLSFIPINLALLVLSIVSAIHIPLLELEGFSRIVLPLFVLVLLQLPLYTRSLRASILQISKSGFVGFAYSQGFSSAWIWYREILPNAFLFTLTLSVVQLSYLVGGTIIIEKVFLVPGLGSKLVDAVMARDRQVVQAIVVLVSSMVGILHFLFVLIRHNMYGRQNE